MANKLSVTAAKERALAERMRKMGVREEDLQEKFVRASGPGGQKGKEGGQLWRGVARFGLREPKNFFPTRRDLLSRSEDQRRCCPP